MRTLMVFRGSSLLPVRVLVCALLVVGIGCGDSEEEVIPITRPQLLVTVDADEDVRREMASIHFRVYADSAGSSRPVQAVYESIFDIVEDDPEWPRVFAIAPRDGELSRRYRVEARAHREESGAGGAAMVQSWMGGYIDETVVPLVLYLGRECIGVVCEDVGETCRAGACVPANLSEESLLNSCESDADCAAASDCALSRCLHSRCVDSLDAELCDEGEVCTYQEGCVPGAYQFACGDGTTIERSKLCDGKPDCASGIDESACAPYEWACANGQGSVAIGQLCDGSQDCFDGSDEFAHCPDESFADMWACGGDDEDAMIPTALVCDGFKNCPNGTDEGESCVREAGVIFCAETSVSIEFVCDGQIDCPDAFDEEHCSQ